MKISLGTFQDTGTDAKMDLEVLKRSHLLIQAASGAGKSWAFRRLAEQLMPHVQVIIIDPEGEYFTLREKFDIVIIGRDSDVPCKLSTAATMAEQLLTLGCHAVVDLSGLKKPEQREYVKLFMTPCTEFPRGPLWHDMVLMMDEAHRFAPEKGESCSTDAVIDFTTLGRKRGYTAIYATQRLSKLHKDAASELQNNLIGRTYLDIDRERAYEQLGIGRDKNVKLEFMQQMKMLEAGEFFALGRCITNERRLVKVGDVETTHIKPGAQKKIAAAPTARVLDILSKLPEMARASEEKKKTNDELLRELNAKTRELIANKKAIDHLEQRIKDQVGKGSHEASAQDLKDMAKLHEANVILENHAKDTQTKYVEFAKTVDGLVDRVAGEIADSIKGTLRKMVRDILHAITPEPLKKYVNLPPRIVPVPHHSRSNPHIDPRSPSGRLDDGKGGMKTSLNGKLPMPSGEAKVMTVIAQYSGKCDNEQITVLTGYKRSSRDAYLQRLRIKGYIGTNGGTHSMTAAGFEALGDFEPLPTGEELREYWLARLPEGEAKILRFILETDDNDHVVSREELEEATGYKRSSRDAYLQRLVNRKLVENVGRGQVKASARLF
jgi:hypothetical protein